MDYLRLAFGASVLMGACASAPQSARPKEPEPVQASQAAASPVEAKQAVLPATTAADPVAPAGRPVADDTPALSVVLPYGGERVVLANNKASLASKLIKQDFAPPFSRAKASKDPGYVLARYNLATLFVSQGDHAKALALLHEIIQTPNCGECDLKQVVLTDEQWLPLWGSELFGALIIKYYPESGFTSDDDPPAKEVEPGSKEWLATMCGPGEVREGKVDQDGEGTLTCTKGGRGQGKYYHRIIGYDGGGEGVLTTIGNYRAGKRHGEWTHFQSFDESWYGYYRGGVKHGWWRTFYLKGDEVHVRYEAFLRGKAEGSHWTVSTIGGDEPAGHVIRRIDYKAGVKHGVQRGWQLDEKARVLIESGSYRQGKKHGAWLDYDPATGHPTALNSYKKGAIEGPYRYWTAAGKQLASGAITKGAGPYLRYVGDKLVEQGNFKRGVREGQWQGAAGRGSYRRGKRIGKWVLNAPEYRAEGQFKNGKRTGLWNYYDSTGKVYASGRFKAGVPIGKWTHVEGHVACPWHDETYASSSSYSELVFKSGRLITADGEALEGSDWSYRRALFVERAELATAYD